MLTDIYKHISSCTVCTQAKVPHTLPASKLMPLPSPQWPWSHITRDFITDLPESKRNRGIMAAIDRFSKLLCLIPLPELPIAFETTELIFNYVFRNVWIPQDIVSDCGTQSTSCVWSSFMEKLGVSVSLTSGYDHQANGQVERAKQEIGCFLCSNCSENQEDWVQFLLWAKYTQNSLCHSAMHLTPFQWTKHFADQHRGETPQYNPGDRIWLCTRDIRNMQGFKKLNSKYIIPYKSLHQVNEVRELGFFFVMHSLEYTQNSIIQSSWPKVLGRVSTLQQKFPPLFSWREVSPYIIGGGGFFLKN